ncbi:phosphoribosyl-AMP cyclohydrolase [Streptococcus pluranimalium]|uniref:Phosphoribosyl-AMP cyclohydrolase n=1 Tax=Streptococcus suis TaxID=1307 RepID=A0A426TE22_STRSU|nr:MULTISPECIES: phosphoribosyl-AMP cyclohydrolase [Streptococcus]MDW8741973.1 phosphoribosyl-AMP cyclohydrolase [Streptococcus suis]MDY3024059.1 phosphoribosyl-AMP cyclohydrolase [Streptococcus hyovaginalis]NQH34450.1 phosphoribosyl-AMP cyclohydrolase [Streptococcus suis]NQH95619.1 phosphoribosyl-AMP cyclohydrolase [Streptococcus suis]NQI34594.1 phosphoribosyl-AMP cyclohydrolase [Streptococcus suis]
MISIDFAKQDGLVPVIVTDHETGLVLMLAYMNEESYQKTLETKQMHYWSRSRQELWHKGATSGHFQTVKSIKTDCDRDTLLISVEQVGAACHTGAYSCFFENIL